MTGIEWTDTTWNPVTGCDRISAGCDNCYALAMAKRLKAMGSAKYQNDGDPRTSGPGFAVTTHPGALDIPRRWRTPRRVFVNSMSDLFHAKVPAEFVAAVVEVIADTPQHTYQVLTKRPARARRMVEHGLVLPPNLWLGTSVENGATTGRITELINTEAAVRFLSCEPLLGPLDLSEWLWWPWEPASFRAYKRRGALHWIIVGGESGFGARSMHPDWTRMLRDQAVEAGVAFFFKQWGGRTPKANGRTLDGRTWDEYPEVAP
jgi:protein gp37